MLLPLPENEIDPMMELAGNELRFESLPVDPHKVLRGFGPLGQLHVSHWSAVFEAAELELVLKETRG